MNPQLYQAIVKGDKDAIEQSHLDFRFQKSHLGNTFLHTAVEFNKKECVEIILRRCPSLILNTNANGDTALHVAARHGLPEIADQLIEGAKLLGIEDVESGEKNSQLRQLLGMVNNEGDTAMHEATRHCDFVMVKLLTRDCHNIEYLANNAGDAPLYLAVNGRRWFIHKMVDMILNATSSVHGGGGSNGMTALHAAVLNDNSVITKLLLDKMPNLNKEKDDYGWIALHYVAYEYSLSIKISELLLKYGSSVACIQEKNGLSPLHIAASKGNTEVIDLLIKYCPDCWQICGKDGRNFLHFASLTGCTWVIEETIKRDNIFRGCINKPDKDGNTPMHLLGKSFPSPEIVRQLLHDNRVNRLAGNRKNMDVLNAMFEDILKKLPNTVRKENLGLLAQLQDRGATEQEQHVTGLFTLLEATATKNITREDVQQLQRESEGKFQRNLVINREDVREPFAPKFLDKKDNHENILKRQNVTQKVSDSHLVVAALIATVTFAAGFALPGGYDPNQGKPALLRFAAFKGFAISNTIATVLSLLAVLIHYLMKIYVHNPDQEISWRVTSLILMTLVCTLGAIFAMLLAFITGTYAVLANSLRLAITSCVLGCSIFVFSFFLLYREFLLVFRVWVMCLRRKKHH